MGSYLGKWSVGLIVIFFLSLTTLYLFCALGQRGGQGFFDNLLLAIPGLVAGIAGIFAFFIGIISIFKDKERSILVFLSTAIGFIVLLWCLAEILFPH